MPAIKADYDKIYRRLLDRYGPQDWWPADEPFEVAVGAVLTQGTAWSNAARAIEALRQSSVLHPSGIDGLDDADLSARIRPAGFHRVKSKRLKSLVSWWLNKGGHQGAGDLPAGELRESLLRVHGIGPETADAIVLYAFEHRVFVVDAYARRLLWRVGVITGNEPYEALRRDIEERFDGDVRDCNEYHALIVEHGKTHCRARPLCDGCCLADICDSANCADPDMG